MAEVFLPNPGYVRSSDDNLHCLQACVQMAMRTKPDGRVYSFDEIDRILHWQPGLYSWEYAIYSAISCEGLDVKLTSGFSILRFVEEGPAYLRQFYGPEAGEVQIKNSDIPVVIEDAKKILNNNRVQIEERVPNFDEMRENIREGWYVIPWVNSRILSDQAGYAGHSIFVYGFNDQEVICHDPGLEGAERFQMNGRRISWEKFEKACSSPSEDARSFGYVRPAHGAPNL